MREGDHLAKRYRLDARLGRGGMSQVWRGHDVVLGRAVALKLLPDGGSTKETLQRFQREATIGARLQHPGITVVHDVGRHNGRLFIVMELLQGRDLACLLADAPDGLPVDRALALARQAAEALAAAHAQGVVHRDLKPGNLFLTTGGRLKICDFGIARTDDTTAALTTTGRPLGTPLYMAPEQWRGEHIDTRCDLYALGCVLHALLTGAPPFRATGGQVWALMHRHLEEVPRSLRSVRAEVPAEVDQLVAALLAKTPDGRPTVAETIATLTRTCGPPEAEPVPTASAAPPPSALPGAVIRARTDPGPHRTSLRPAILTNRFPVWLPRFVGCSQLRVAAWHHGNGSTVQAGEPLLRITADEDTVDIRSPVTGVIIAVIADEDTAVRPGSLLCLINTAPGRPRHP
ncbi:protein kinase domain-containing protein [Streptomyces sp. NRRL WC-3742]|uniref:protein kinase domain-containing protein n=1 Tax=Streptomyces sp. NRRL WC-3742 TaxID=1463934 RepID=UPI00068A383A|nr:protein kinase [Streptomyces sp. NRRL WC-3742]